MAASLTIAGLAKEVLPSKHYVLYDKLSCDLESDVTISVAQNGKLAGLLAILHPVCA